VSVETRQALVKQLGSQAERSRQRLRNIRRAALAVVKQGKDGKLEGISKDDAFRVQKEVDIVMETVTKQLNDMLEQKQASIMSV
jgi:ribosome recycling factor